MPTEIETQIHNYFEWVEHRTGHHLRAPSATGHNDVGETATFRSDPTVPPSDFSESDPQRRAQVQHRLRNTILLAAAATLAVVGGLVAIGDGRTENPTTPAAQPQPSESAPLPGWEGDTAIKVFMRSDASDAQLAAVEALLDDSTDALAEWSYLDADASLQEAARVLADDPGTLELLDADNIPTVFNLVATPAATNDSLDQLAKQFAGLAGVVDAVTIEQARQESSADAEAVESSETVTETTRP